MSRSYKKTVTAPGTAASTGAWVPIDIYADSVRVNVDITDATTTAAEIRYAIQFTMDNVLSTTVGRPHLTISTAGVSAFTTAIDGGFHAVRFISSASGAATAASDSTWRFYVTQDSY